MIDFYQIILVKREKKETMASRYPKDWDALELDPILETNGQTVVRKMDRKLPEYSAPLVAFFRALMFIVECALPNCTGHQKYGVVVEENIPVIFRRHDQGQPAIYVPFKNPISRPMKVPEDGENMLMGLKWRATDRSTLNDTWNTVQNIFDCLLADLRFRMMTKDFCLECLFAHTNGRGLLLERFIKTILYHIVPWGRSKEKEQYKLITKYEKKMDMKFKRIWWGSIPVKTYCDAVNLREHHTIERQMALFSEPYPIEPQTGILRNLDSITRMDVIVKCHCYGGKPRVCQSYGGIMRKVKTPKGSNCEFSIVPARWLVNGDEYEDPMWNYSNIGFSKPTEFFQKNIAEPLARNCEKCKGFLNIIDTQIPETTWLYMADLTDSMRKSSVYNLQGITSYQIGGVVFIPAFVLVYNTQKGHFTTLNLIAKNEWRFFDDLCGGLFKPCDPNKVKYSERINLRVFFYRKTETNPHSCLSRAARVGPENV